MTQRMIIKAIELDEKIMFIADVESTTVLGCRCFSPKWVANQSKNFGFGQNSNDVNYWVTSYRYLKVRPGMYFELVTII